MPIAAVIAVVLLAVAAAAFLLAPQLFGNDITITGDVTLIDDDLAGSSTNC